jgi:CO/xanthine dehydrogenase FAD-binding subunit
MSIAELSDYDFARPQTLQEACLLLDRAVKEGRVAWPIAGCTDWMVERRASVISDQPAKATAIDLTRIPELRGITSKQARASIGAAETFLAIRRNEMIARACPMLADMAAGVGAVQIQARGTLGGNLVSGSPAADGVVALFALDADVILATPAGERSVPIRSFYTGYRTSVRKPEEIVVRFEFALPRDGARQQWRKVGTRSAQAISKVSLAMVAETDASGVISRVGFGAGSVAPTVRALDGARALLEGQEASTVDLGALEKAIDLDIEPMDDLRSTGRYRRHVAKTLIRQFLEELAAKKSS